MISKIIYSLFFFLFLFVESSEKQYTVKTVKGKEEKKIDISNTILDHV